MKFTIEITENCSLNCIHCSTRASPNKDYFMSEEDFEKYVSQYPDLEVIKFSGGEPFQHPMLPDFLKTVKERHDAKKTEVLSCGNYYGGPIPLKNLSLCKPYLDKIMFSIYGDSENHDRICQTRGARNNLSRTIENCLQLDIPFKFETLAMPGVNLEQIFKYVSSLNRDTSIKVMRLINQGNACEIDLPSEEWIKNFKQEASKLHEEYKVPMRFSCSLTGRCLAQRDKKALVLVDKTPKIVNCSSMKYSNQKYFGCRE